MGDLRVFILSKRKGDVDGMKSLENEILQELS